MTTEPAPLVLRAGSATATVLPAAGARLGSLVVDGHELLLTEGFRPMAWGSYPMAPWAGRIRRGRFRFDGGEYQLPLGMPPHAIHGTVYDRPWTVTGPDTVSVDLGPDWPFEGRVTQRFELAPDALSLTMTLDAQEPMPAVLGWHPWFRRRLDPEAPPVRMDLDVEAMYRRDTEGIPDGLLIPPTAGPWDDTFRLRSSPTLEWPGVLRLELESDATHWVVYTEPEHAVCVEPQTGPPDGLTLEPRVVEPGAPLTLAMIMRWSRG